MAFPQVVQLKPGWEKIVGATREKRLAQDAYMFPGRWFRYALAGEAATVAFLQTGITATDAEDLDLVPAANVAIGATSLTIASLTLVADEYRDGFLLFNDQEEVGHQYLLGSHLAYTAATATINIDEEDGLVVAITTAQQMGLIHSICHDFVVYPTSHTGSPIGAPCVDFADNDHGWLQYRGPGTALTDVTVAITAGDALTTSLTVAGELELFDKSEDTGDVGVVAWMGDAVGANSEASAVLWVM